MVGSLVWEEVGAAAGSECWSIEVRKAAVHEEREQRDTRRARVAMASSTYPEWLRLIA